ncbi:hypothetical protein [Agrobacterium tumefaciens]|uniref:DUF551 domain-containing protein n=1 Tax=Agrobacterium tumefaciens TaxID=358 RepID=A0A2L2LC74_AGRTU|nr:hypothetical protein [Agrobacterium tumefaciens]AVH41856.1 hypothetical protein At1D1609_18020 [Agrobacterium tumefaciens]NSY95773.1 hypothetical protein [Agrobacterium tumefaciens]
MNWNYDISAAPRGKMVPTTVKTKDGLKETETYQREYIIAAGHCGAVTKSYWIPDQERWCMFSKDVPPRAWMPWPENPFAAATTSEAALTKAPTNVSLPVDERSGEWANAGGDDVTGGENAHTKSAGELVSNSSAFLLEDVGSGQ